MKAMHRLIVTSEAYKLASEATPAVAAGQRRGRPDQCLSLALPPPPPRGRADLGRDLGARPAASTRPSAARRSTRPGAGAACGAGRPRRPVQPSRRLHDPRLLDQPRRRAGLPPGVRRRRRPRSLPGADADRHRAAGPVPDEWRRDRAGDRDASPSGSRRSPAAISPRPSTSPTGSRSPAAVPARADRCPGLPRRRPGRLKGLAWLLFNLDEFLYVR